MCWPTTTYSQLVRSLPVSPQHMLNGRRILKSGQLKISENIWHGWIPLGVIGKLLYVVGWTDPFKNVMFFVVLPCISQYVSILYACSFIDDKRNKLELNIFYFKMQICTFFAFYVYKSSNLHFFFWHGYFHWGSNRPMRLFLLAVHLSVIVQLHSV